MQLDSTKCRLGLKECTAGVGLTSLNTYGENKRCTFLVSTGVDVNVNKLRHHQVGLLQSPF